MTETLTTTDQWLAEFGEALERGDPDRAAGMFGEQSFWRDLIAFSWNIVTVEGPAGVARPARGHAGTDRADRLAHHRGADRGRRRHQAWIAFETAVGRGHGLLRLVEDGKAWTLLTTLVRAEGA